MLKRGGYGTDRKLERSVTFGRATPSSDWALIGDEHLSSSVRAVVDVDSKKLIAPQIAVFKEWLYAIMPLVMQDDFRAIERMAREDFAKGVAAMNMIVDVPPVVQAGLRVDVAMGVAGYVQRTDAVLSLIRDAVLQPDHPLKTSVAYYLIGAACSAEENYTGHYYVGDDGPDVSLGAVSRRHKSRINRGINVALGLVSKT